MSLQEGLRAIVPAADKENGSMADTKLQFNKRKFRGLSGNQIKMIAFFLMLCESVGVLILNGKLYAHNPMYYQMAISTTEGQRWYLISRILRFLGRPAFPIFAFFVAEGFRYTASAGKYILRMGIFAALSEVPFDLAYYGTVYYPEYQNVLFTYFFGLLALFFMSLAKKLPFILQLMIAAPFCYIAYWAKCDYGALGVALIVVLYVLRHERKIRLFAGAAISAAESLEYYGVSALAFLLLRLYNGNRGDAALKYFFYLMYPLQLLGFYLLVYFANR